MVIRHARAADLPAIVSLLADDPLGRAREDPGAPVNRRYRSAFEAIERDPNQLLAVAEQDETVIGCLQVSLIPGLSRLGAWRGQIEGVRVHAAHRNAGAGHRLVEWAIEQCRARGCELVQLTTDKSRPDALRFYESLGFVASHEGLKRPLRPAAAVSG